MWNPALIDGPVTIYTYGPEQTDAEGITYRPVTGTIPGYHLNVAPSVAADGLEAFRVYPETPERVFAGAETVFLCFADEAGARSHLGAYWIEVEGD